MNTQNEKIKKLATEAYSYILTECNVEDERIQIIASYILAIRENTK